MEFPEYIKSTRSTALYPNDQAITYLTLGLCGEAGEVAELVKKGIRAGKTLNRATLRDELGDVIWYWVRLCEELGLKPQEVMENNVHKLTERNVRGTIKER